MSGYLPGGYLPSGGTTIAEVYATEASLPTSAGIGTTAITSDTGSMWMWDGTRWKRIPDLGLVEATALGCNLA